MINFNKHFDVTVAALKSIEFNLTHGYRVCYTLSYEYLRAERGQVQLVNYKINAISFIHYHSE
jgi:hypothetical protein